MRKMLLLAAAIGGLSALATTGANAAPAVDVPHAVAGYQSLVTHVDYYYNHHHYHHRRWDKKHRRWYYYN